MIVYLPIRCISIFGQEPPVIVGGADDEQVKNSVIEAKRSG
jgi:hypothetical protein